MLKRLKLLQQSVEIVLQRQLYLQKIICSGFSFTIIGFYRSVSFHFFSRFISHIIRFDVFHFFLSSASIFILTHYTDASYSQNAGKASLLSISKRLSLKRIVFRAENWMVLLDKRAIFDLIKLLANVLNKGRLSLCALNLLALKEVWMKLK